MDDRIERLERLAALHRDGTLNDDEFREEKLRVLGGRRAEPDLPRPEPLPPSVSPLRSRSTDTPVSPREWSREPDPVLADLPDPGAGDRVPDARRGRPWVKWVAIAAVVAVLIAAALFARSIGISDAPRSSIGTAEHREAPGDEAALNARVEPAPQNTIEPAEQPDERKDDLAASLALTDPADCEFSSEGRRAFDALLSRSGDGWSAGGPVRLGTATLTPRVVVSQVNPVPSEGGEPADETAAAPQVAPSVRTSSSVRAPDGLTWNGLSFSRLVRSHLSRPDGGTMERRGLTFREPPEAVRQALEGAGVDVPAGGRSLGGSCPGTMRVEAIPGGSALTCERRCS